MNITLDDEMNGSETEVSEKNEGILEQALERFKICEEAHAERRRLFEDDVRFSEGQQWDPSLKQSREEDGRPCLVINKVNQSINQVTNDQRQNRPSIKVHAVDDGGDVEVAKIQQGLIRNIEQSSNADAAYDTAFEYVARGGEGYWRVITEYSSPTSFDLDLKIKRIRDPLTVYIDPHSVEPDGSDAMYGFVFERIAKDEYQRLYAKSELSQPSANEWSTYDSQTDGWVTKDTCLVTEYFVKNFVDVEVCLLDTGKVVEKSKLDMELYKLQKQGIQASVIKERVASVPKIKWYKLNGVEILDETDFPGIFIPIVPCYGAELVIDGKLIRKGITRDAKDPQRMVNFWSSNEAEAIATAPKAPYIGYEGQFEGFEREWASANRKNHAFLQVKALTVAGQQVPLPQRQAFEPAIQAITQARMLASDDLKAATGIYDAGLGAKSNETSGVAIQRRATQGQTANFHLVDNLSRSIKHTGRILIYAIPEIYDSARAARIIGDDGSDKIVKINQPIEENGKMVTYSFDAGKYDVTVDVGPSFQTKRQEAVASMLEMTRSVPQIMQVAGDLLIKAMDMPYASEISDRLKKMLPPNLQDENKDKKEADPQMMAQMQQAHDMIDQLTKQLNESKDKEEQKTLELESKERIEFKKLEVQLEIERAKLDARDSLALLDAEINSINQRLSMLNIGAPIEEDPQHEMMEQEQVQPEMIDGAQGAYVDDQGQPPIGGFSPSQPME